MRKGIKITLIVLLVLIIIFIVSLFIIGLSFGEKIAVVEIEGVIMDTKDVVEDIVRFRDDKDIKGVIVRINSPGGSTGPTQEIFREIKKLREKKPVYVSMGAVCASGGYYIASGGNKIYALPSTITGSIGVIMENVVMEDLLKKIGIQAEPIKAGTYKDLGSPFRKMKQDERAYIQEILDSIHSQFIKDIAESRKMKEEIVKQYADGRIFTGIQAKSFGLVDVIGTYYDTIEDMKKAVNIKGKPVIVKGKRPFSILKLLVSSFVKEIYSEMSSLKYYAPFKFMMVQ
ncbi:MAG TPA: signal peptide peptidase SppA [Syntrophorhabdaceae bacterium]|nr:signal peptide peptidase SppA [Syntrophorhabdaceae bacterium]HPU29677.1 signal peptide peptidase SppA [Syntrophorhabdaceae bacterium]